MNMTTPYTVLALAFLLVTSLASAQTVDPALRPPKGAQVALVVFEDLQCPDCRRANPLRLDRRAESITTGHTRTMRSGT